VSREGEWLWVRKADSYHNRFMQIRWSSKERESERASERERGEREWMSKKY
jgi:hypothetical protein